MADAEQHFFVDADSSNVIRRKYWIQFEQYLPGRGGEYAYDGNDRIPSPATRIRLVYVPFEDRREELMIMYLEPLMRRARKGLTITR